MPSSEAMSNLSSNQAEAGSKTSESVNFFGSPSPSGLMIFVGSSLGISVGGGVIGGGVVGGLIGVLSVGSSVGVFVGGVGVTMVDVELGVGVTMVVVGLGVGSAVGSLFEHPFIGTAVTKVNAMIAIFRVARGIGTPSFSCCSADYMEVPRISLRIDTSR